MNKKLHSKQSGFGSLEIVLALVVVVVLALGGWLLYKHGHKNTVKTSTSTSQSAIVTNSVLITKTDSSLGKYLAEPSGQALYTYSSDASGVSNCTASCLATWPAYQDKGSTTGLPTGVSTLKRTDNSEVQYTYNGMPLYTFVGDTNNQVTGNGVSNFTVAKPAATTTSSSTAPATTSSSNW